MSVQSQRTISSFFILGRPIVYLFLPLDAAMQAGVKCVCVCARARMCANISKHVPHHVSGVCARMCSRGIDVAAPPASCPRHGSGVRCPGERPTEEAHLLICLNGVGLLRAARRL